MIDSPIGRDDGGAPVAEPPVVEPTVEPVVEPSTEDSPPEGPTEKPPLPTAERDALTDKAAIFDLMASDPQMASQLEGFIHRLSGRVPQDMQTPQATPAVQPSENGNDELSQLRAQMGQMQQQIQQFQVGAAQQQVTAFAADKPDFDRYRREVGKMVTDHNLTLDDAWTLVRAREGAQAPVQSTETASNAVGRRADARGSEAILDEARQKIANLKPGKLSQQEATKIAWEAAERYHAQ